MTLNDYLAEWEKDASFDLSELDVAARNVPMLHAKWWAFYSTERLRFKKLDLQGKLLHRQKWEWFSGKMLDEDRQALGWDIQPLRILPPNLPMYMAADPVLQEHEKKRIVSEEILKFLEDVIKNINNRGYILKTAVDFLKFKMGA